MPWYPAYLDSKQEIVDWAKEQNPNLKSDDIPDVDIKMADVMIFSVLNEHGITVDYTGTVSGGTVDPADINYFLWAASLAYNLEFLSYRGTIYYTPGGIAETRFGDIVFKFMRMQPMFFLGQGLRNLDKVMPFRSYKQIAQSFVDAFVTAKMRNVSGTTLEKPVVMWDASSRGFGWNADIDTYIEPADDELYTGL